MFQTNLDKIVLVNSVWETIILGFKWLLEQNRQFCFFKKIMSNAKKSGHLREINKSSSGRGRWIYCLKNPKLLTLKVIGIYGSVTLLFYFLLSIE